MNKTANSNMYDVTADSILAVYGDLIDGDGTATVLVVSSESVSEEARRALEKSMVALDVGSNRLAYVQTASSDGQNLGSTDLFTIIEGLDPIYLIIADASSAQLTKSAYRQNLPLDARCRLFGRSTIVLRALNDLFDSEDNKQRLWALLKLLAK